MSSSGLQNSPEAQINQDMTIGVTTTLLTLCIISYVVRIVSRKVMKSGLWLDDYWMAFVLVYLPTKLHILKLTLAACLRGNEHPQLPWRELRIRATSVRCAPSHAS